MIFIGYGIAAPELHQDAPQGGVVLDLASQHRRAGHNDGAACELRLDDQLTTHQLETFLHAGQAESETSIRRLHVEAYSFITNGEIDGVAGAPESYVETADLAVSHRVVTTILPRVA